jgi:hypothetical protein
VLVTQPRSVIAKLFHYRRHAPGLYQQPQQVPFTRFLAGAFGSKFLPGVFHPAKLKLIS